MSLQPATDDRNKQLLYKIAALIEGGAIGGGVDPDVIFGLRPGGDFTGATFTGNSLATFIDSGGLVRFAPHNFFTKSEDVSIWSQEGLVFTADATTAPDGTTTADKIATVAGAGLTNHRIFVGNDIGGTLSVYVKKAGTNDWVGIGYENGGYPSVWFNLVTGAKGATGVGQIQSVGNGWYRIAVQGTSATPIYPNITPVNADGIYAFYDATGTEAVYIWGWQHERNITASPYVKTTGTPILRTPRNAHYVQGNRTLLLEGARTNFILQNNDISQAVWVKTGVTVLPNAVTAPDGSMTASKLTATLADSYIHQSYTTTGQITFSLWLKADVPFTLRIYPDGGTSFAFDVTTQWKRFSATLTIGAATNFVIGAGGTFTTGAVLYVWGVQAEVGPSASSLIYTTTAAVTRAADFLRFPAPPPQEMTAFVRGYKTAKDEGQHFLLTIGGAPPSLDMRWVGNVRMDDIYFGTSAGFNSGAQIALSPPITAPTLNGVSYEARLVFTLANMQGMVSVEGGSEASSGLGAMTETPVAWGGPVLTIGGYDGTNYPAFDSFRDIIIAKGVKDLAYFRTQVNRPPDILHWKMNEGSGTAVAAAVGPGGTTNASWVTGKSGSGLSFNGTSQSSSTNAPVVYGANTITLCGWFWFDTTAGIMVLLESEQVGVGPDIFNVVINGGVELNNTGTAGQATTVYPISAVTTGAWHHLAFIFSPSYSNFYLNGVKQTPSSNNFIRTGANNFATKTLYLGARTNSIYWSTCRVDDFRIFTGDRSSDLAAIMADAQ